MKISNEDKILLLEFLGYEVVQIEGKPFAKTAAFEFPVEPFDTLDISILFEAVDMVEKGNSLLKTSLIHDCGYYSFILEGISKEPYIEESAHTREEAILKTVLQYIKTIS